MRGGDGRVALFLMKQDGVNYDILQKTDQSTLGGFQHGPFPETGTPNSRLPPYARFPPTVLDPGANKIFTFH